MDRTDALAAHDATRQVSGLLQRANSREWDLGWSDDADNLARVIVDGFTVTYERRDGKRRPILYGPWEVDPTHATAVSGG